MKNKDKKEYIFIISGVAIFFISVVVISAYSFLSEKESEPLVAFSNESSDAESEQVLRRKIDGKEVEDELSSNLYPVAIMIENAADAWPLTGLDKAQIVIEAITEASIPRFVAIYANNDQIDKIGPVRSARPYYLDWINPFAPLYMHVGGAPQALTKLRSKSYQLVDFDQFFNSQYYWRDTKWRYAPHNVYTSSELISKALAKKDLSDPIDYQMWNYKYDNLLEQRPEQIDDITILYTKDYYRVDWKYDRESNDYLRYQYKKIQKMSDGAEIRAKNIIVQVNSMKVIDNVGRKEITTTGEGKAWIFRDGETIEGKWEKESIEKRIQYFDAADQKIEFNGGTTWIEVIPKEDYLRY